MKNLQDMRDGKMILKIQEFLPKVPELDQVFAPTRILNLRPRIGHVMFFFGTVGQNCLTCGMANRYQRVC